MIIRSSQRLNRVITPGPSVEQRKAQAPIRWPRYLGGKVRMVPIPPEQIPRGWQSVQIHVPMRLATCEEVECPFLANGWTEVLPADGSRHTRPGKVSRDEAAETFGRYGPRELVPNVIHHPPGTMCPGDASLQEPGELLSTRTHKVPSGIPPLYTINGRVTQWTEFEDALGGGLERARTLAG